MRNDFKKLLESVKERCPELITEEVVSNMMKTFDDGISKITADAEAVGLEQGQAQGFKDGYTEGKRVAQDQAQAELAALTEKMDEEAVQKLTSVLQMIDENHTAKLQELYDFMTSKINDTLALQDQAVADALEKQDEEYATKFETAIDAINDDHAAKFETAINAINDDHAEKLCIYKEAVDKKYNTLLTESMSAIDNEHTAKLTEIVNAFKENKAKAIKLAEENILKEQAVKINDVKILYENKIADLNNEIKAEKARKLNILAEGVEKYLNYALEQFKPKSQIISEQKYNTAINTLEKVTDLLKVNKIIQESKDGIFANYESKLSKAKEEQTRLINETIDLKNQLNIKEAQLVLESKIQKCTPGEARFLRGYFKGATSPKLIEESIEAAHAAYKKIVSEQRQTLQESVRKSTNSLSSVISEEKNEPVKTQVISESNRITENQEETTQEKLVDLYASYLQPKK